MVKLLKRNVMMFETNVWCVIVRGNDGRQWVAHTNDGAAVYYYRKNALKLAKDLREHGFKVRVEKCKVMFDDARVNKPRRKHGK